MTTSASNREEFLEKAKRVQTILQKDEFYSNPSEEEYKTAITLIHEISLQCLELDKNKSSRIWKEIFEVLLLIKTELEELKEKRKQGTATNANTIWSWKFPGGIIVSIPVKLQMLELFKVMIIPAFTNTKEYQAFSKKVHQSDFGKLTDKMDLNDYDFQIIFDAIYASYSLKFPEGHKKAGERWLVFRLDIANKAYGIGDVAFVDRSLISTQGIVEETKANSWRDKLNKIAGFENAVSVIQRATGWYLSIQAPIELVEKLKKINSDKSKEVKATAAGISAAGVTPSSGQSAVRAATESEQTNASTSAVATSGAPSQTVPRGFLNGLQRGFLNQGTQGTQLSNSTGSSATRRNGR